MKLPLPELTRESIEQIVNDFDDDYFESDGVDADDCDTFTTAEVVQLARYWLAKQGEEGK